MGVWPRRPIEGSGFNGRGTECQLPKQCADEGMSLCCILDNLVCLKDLLGMPPLMLRFWLGPTLCIEVVSLFTKHLLLNMVNQFMN